MNYEIIELEEKTVAGLTARTNNQSPDMAPVIGGLWERFYREAYAGIPGKKNDKAIGLYSGYAGDEMDDYDITVCCEIGEADGEAVGEGICVKKIPAGRYARFIVTGDLHQAVMEFWQNLWGMKLNRAFTCDFEEYQNADGNNAVIHMYISLKEE